MVATQNIQSPSSASDFYKNGPSFLQRHLPLWLNVYVQRAIAVLLTAIAVGLPLFGYAPRLYRWLVEYRLGSIYRSLRVIEASLQADIDREEIAALAVELDRLDREVNNHRVPMRHSDIFFRVKSDLHLVRMRLGAQCPERLPERRPDHDNLFEAARPSAARAVATISIKTVRASQ